MGGGARELDRLESLRSYGLLDTPPEEDFDALAVLAALGTESPAAAVVLVDADRFFVKAGVGFDRREVPRSELTCCSHAVATREPVVVQDLQADPRFSDDPRVKDGSLRAYAGVPLIGRDGLPVGTLCVHDTRPRTFTLPHLAALRSIARQAVALMELRRLDLRMGNLPTGPGAHLAEPQRLRLALEQDELVPWFQPIVRLEDGRPTGVEALLRWHHPEHGVLFPAEFLPAVESSGLILPVGRDVLTKSLLLLEALDDLEGLPRGMSVSVNVSAVQLAQPGLCDQALSVLQGLGLEPGRLTLELTESASLLDRRVARAEIAGLSEAGVRLALDDYGTGYSNLQRALDLPWDVVKLDRSLVHQFAGDARARRAAASVMSTFRDLGLRVVAEGIETEDQREALLELGCAHGQGWLFGRPVPAADAVGALSDLADGSTARP